MSALAAMILTAYLASARSDTATGLELPVITAVVLGGVNIFGGAGTMPGVLIALLVLAFVQNALGLAGVTPAVSRVIESLPIAIRDGSNLGARSSLAWADTLAGLAICGSGMALPCGIAMAVSSLFADISHGQALASVYRACLDFTCSSAVSTFARLARLLDPALNGGPSTEAAERCPELLQAFLARIDLACTLRDFGISKEELTDLARQSMALPNYKNNPRVPTQDEMLEVIAASY